ncbi:MAG: hypothetical protein GWQ05_15330 [Verrucomicrobiaceae bacterium]|nr:hypothetical protein [Verrucomicrobiaceae bacterium]
MEFFKDLQEKRLIKARTNSLCRLSVFADELADLPDHGLDPLALLGEIERSALLIDSFAFRANEIEAPFAGTDIEAFLKVTRVRN